jgi:hypothetical protein
VKQALLATIHARFFRLDYDPKRANLVIKVELAAMATMAMTRVERHSPEPN